MRRRELGKSGISVSAIGLGCWGMSGSYGPADEDESVATLHHALDLGVDFIDTADSYGEDGHNESLIGRSPEGSPPRVRPGDQDGLGQAGRAGWQDGRRRRWASRPHPLGLRGEPGPLEDRRDRPLLPAPGRSRRAGGGVGRGDVRTGRRREGPVPGTLRGLGGHAAASPRRPPDHGPPVRVLALDPRARGDGDAGVPGTGDRLRPVQPAGTGLPHRGGDEPGGHRTGRLAGEQPPLHGGEPRPQPRPAESPWRRSPRPTAGRPPRSPWPGCCPEGRRSSPSPA